MQKYFIILLLVISWSTHVLSAYYDTVPSGRRALIMKGIKLSTISSKYNHLSQAQDMSFDKTINLSTLADLSADLKSPLQTIQATRPDIAEKLVLTGFAADLEADISVQAYGLAFGLTDHLMVYGALPIFTAKVNPNLRRTKQNNYKEALTNKNIPIPDTNIVIAVKELEDLSGEFLQSVAVNTLNYKPLGSWEAKDLGDVELGLFYRLTDWNNSGLAISIGTILPTGRQDDPDLLQDIPFGDGQTDLFVEFGGGFRPLNSSFSFNSFVRYTAQLSSIKKIRAPITADFVAFGDHYIDVDEKLGDKIDFRAMATFSISDMFSISGGYEMSMKFLNSYQSSNASRTELEMLEVNSDSEIHYIKSAISMSTIQAFLAQKFLLPLTLELSAQSSFAGRNNIKADRYELTLSMFF